MAAAGAAGAAAAQQKRKKDEEEEMLTEYRPIELEGWEFKIVRSAARITGEKFEQLCQEEAQNGWELLEKFDDYRVRFKRKVEKRQDDGYENIDPYRTTFGLTENRLALFIVLGVLGVMGVVVYLAITFG